ncbi:MAG TPA: GNAT family N-acetyltransferase, partial [Thermoleophilia bacterium]|nr:GNAT family N-acetyltransferase [Thermoleophilia bacterium]
ELLRQRGFQLVRTVYRMAADLETPAALGPVPEGITIRDFRPDEDERVMHTTMQEAFADDFWRTDEPFDAWKTQLRGHSDFDPSLWFLAWDGDQAAGGLVAYDHGDVGWIKGLGVRRPWRGRGIGSALLAHAFSELARRGQRRAELGVDAEGAAQPLRVYERAGMHVAFAFESYTLRLGGPEVASP